MFLDDLLGPASCLFHPGETRPRKMSELGLRKTYHSENAAGSFLRSHFCLSFLLSDVVKECSVQDLEPIEPDDATVTQFCAYMCEKCAKLRKEINSLIGGPPTPEA